MGTQTTGFARFRADKYGVPLKVVQELPDNCVFDAVYCTELLEHVTDPWAHLERMYELLKKTGILLVTHSFELTGEKYPQHLKRHEGLGLTFIKEVEARGFQFQKQIQLPGGNRFFVFRKGPQFGEVLLAERCTEISPVPQGNYSE